MRVLVTGGSGFIGRHIVARLTGTCEVLAPAHSELDLADAAAVQRWFARHHVDAVVHAAVKPGHRNAVDTTALAEQNLRQFFSLERCRSEFGRFVVLGSGAAYGVQRPLSAVAEEELGNVVPADAHGFSKYVEALRLEQDDDAVELRPFGVYGPGEDYAIRFVSNACCKAVFDLPITLRRDRRFSYVWVEDLAAVVEAALCGAAAGGLDAGAYNVVPSKPTRLREIAEAVVGACGKELPVLVAEDGLGPDYVGDGHRLAAALPTLAVTSVVEGVSLLYEWYAGRRERLDRAALLEDR